MAFSYTPTLPTALDRVRHALGDTNEDVPLRSDETIGAVLVIAGTTAGATTVSTAEATATADLASALAVEYAQKPDSFSESGGVSVSWRERVKGWQLLAKTTRESLVATNAAGVAWSAPAERADAEQSEYYREPACYGRNWFTE